jgi:uncharacterized protein (TIGR03435 family)
MVYRNAIRAMGLFGFAWLALAQSGAQFDAASVKPDGGEFCPRCIQVKGGPGTRDPGRITYTRVRLKFLVTKAWDLQGDQVSGPDWLMRAGGDDSYAITATMPANTSKEQFQAMLQNLLIERFQLKLHHETRSFPGYELVVADGGAKLHETAQDPGLDAADPFDFRGFDDNRFPIMPPGPGFRTVPGKGEERIRAQAQTMAEFAAQLGGIVRGVTGADLNAPLPRVMDKTGLTGRYDFTLAFDCPGCQGLAGLPMSVRDSVPMLAGNGPGQGGGAASATPVAPDPGSGFPGIYVAIEKQLGLKLVKTKDVSLDFVVIDHAEKVLTGN